ncbi:MAG: hypothetical protein GY941_09710 [Planctomycetes bacterium]|nr:hypothetical protein [Planctomycetota bacterium]
MKINEIMVQRKKVVVRLLLCFSCLLVVIMLFSSITLMAEEARWQPVTELEAIKVFKRFKEGSSFLEFKAVGVLSGTAVEYASALLETESMIEWAPLCIGAQNIELINDRETIIHVVCKGIWPAADREYTARRSLISEPDAGVIRIKLELVEHQNTRNDSGRVKIPHLKAHWVFTEIDSARTHVELYVDVDPGGLLPAWLVNFGYRKVPYRFLKGLETQVVNGRSHHPVLAALYSGS